MDQLKGSVRFIPLSSVTQFIAGLGATGLLKVAQGNWSGSIALREGQIVAAELAAERGRAALEAMMLALTEAEFAFVEAHVEPAEAPVVSRDELGAFMTGLIAERARLNLAPGPALSSVPCLIEQSDGEPSQVTIPSAALQLIPALVHGHTLEQIAQRRGLARTLRDIAVLRAGGLVRLEAPAAQPAQAPSTTPAAPAVRQLRAVPTEPRAVQPQPSERAIQPAPGEARTLKPVAATPRLVQPAASEPRGVQSQPSERTLQPVGPRRGPWAHMASTAAAAQAPIELPRPRLEAVPNDATRSAEPAAEQRPRSWRHAVVGFFVAHPAARA